MRAFEDKRVLFTKECNDYEMFGVPILCMSQRTEENFNWNWTFWIFGSLRWITSHMRCCCNEFHSYIDDVIEARSAVPLNEWAQNGCDSVHIHTVKNKWLSSPVIPINFWNGWKFVGWNNVVIFTRNLSKILAENRVKSLFSTDYSVNVIFRPVFRNNFSAIYIGVCKRFMISYYSAQDCLFSVQRCSERMSFFTWAQIHLSAADLGSANFGEDRFFHISIELFVKLEFLCKFTALDFVVFSMLVHFECKIMLEDNFLYPWAAFTKTSVFLSNTRFACMKISLLYWSVQ